MNQIIVNEKTTDENRPVKLLEITLYQSNIFRTANNNAVDEAVDLIVTLSIPSPSQKLRLLTINIDRNK